ncbi:MFS transporter [Actinocorallia longicatena]|uniref:MFS transporter n=1 Tax=Actinocorallia longicatena TaxID=111803 RepID=A0ABP6QDM7_9ACTN
MRTVPSPCPSPEASRPGLWHHSGFRMLAAADAVSQVGSQITMIALPLVALLVLHASPAQIGLLTAFETAGFLLVGLPSGVWVDRMRKKPVMVVCDLVRAVALGSVPLAYLLDALTLPHLYAAALATGIATVFFQVAYQSYLPFLVDRDQLMEGNTKLQVIATSAEVAGPGAGGLLVRFAGGPFAVFLDALSFAVSAVFLFFIKAKEPEPEAARRGLWVEMREGMEFLLRHAVLRLVIASGAIANLFGVAMMAMLPVFFVDQMGIDAGTFGIVLGASGIGGVLGAMTTGRQIRLLGEARMLWVNAIGAGLAFLLVPIAAPGWRVLPAALGLGLDAFLIAGWAVASVSLRQRLTPDALLGRVNATARFLNWGVMPIGAILGGVCAQLTDPRTTLLIAGVGYVCAALPILLSPLRGMRDLPQAPGVQR